ncbi:MAG: alpha-hydroxy-acid oxidizing protein [Actinomycetota bacterium]|nr:alpha-hydroxy-acid oxidizing protein [Actinomycetota bacterium]
MSRSGEERPPITLAEYEERARATLPRMAFDYFAGGAEDEWTLGQNRAAFSRYALRPRVLVDVSSRDAATTVLGQEVSLPVLVAPTALHALADPEGEVATARAAAAAGSVMILSSLSSRTLEEVAEAGGRRWFQLYVQRDRDFTAGLVKRADAAGYSAIVLTADLPVVGARDRDVRNDFQLPGDVRYANMLVQRPPEGRGSGLAAFIGFQGDPSLSWEDVSWLRSLTGLPFVLKGVVRADDARRAVDAGFEGIVVSNHGGRQLDGAVSSMDALPEVVEAVGDAADVLVDGGVRRGSDVLKALALGARAVLVGRPVLWGLAVDGEDGVRRVLDLLRAELDVAMAIAGCRSVADATPDLVARAGG